MFAFYANLSMSVLSCCSCGSSVRLCAVLFCAWCGLARLSECWVRMSWRDSKCETDKSVKLHVLLIFIWLANHLPCPSPSWPFHSHNVWMQWSVFRTNVQMCLGLRIYTCGLISGYCILRSLDYLRLPLVLLRPLMTHQQAVAMSDCDTLVSWGTLQILVVV